MVSDINIDTVTGIDDKTEVDPDAIAIFIYGNILCIVKKVVIVDVVDIHTKVGTQLWGTEHLIKENVVCF